MSTAGSRVIKPDPTVSTRTFPGSSANFRARFRGEDRRYPVGRSLSAVLVLPAVPRHRAVRRIALQRLATGDGSTLVISPSEPKPCATVSDCTSSS
jgi:hypothetical protein